MCEGTDNPVVCYYGTLEHHLAATDEGSARVLRAKETPLPVIRNDCFTFMDINTKSLHIEVSVRSLLLTKGL